MTVRPFAAPDRDAVVDIWERAVRATHHFLTEADIEFYRPLVRDQYLDLVEVFVAVSPEMGIVGFLGLSGAKVEMLFVAPEHHGMGWGRRLLDHGRRLHSALTVDVNEQNSAAHAFYLHYGFTETGRSPLDHSGRPFPLIHLGLT